MGLVDMVRLSIPFFRHLMGCPLEEMRSHVFCVFPESAPQIRGQKPEQGEFVVLWITLSTCLVPEMGLSACEKNATW